MVHTARTLEGAPAHHHLTGMRVMRAGAARRIGAKLRLGAWHVPHHGLAMKTLSRLVALVARDPILKLGANGKSCTIVRYDDAKGAEPAH